MPITDVLRPRRVRAYPLSKLCSTLETESAYVGEDVSLTGVTHDSRQVQPGDLYVALPGARAHGAQYVDAAVRAGAAAVLTDPAGAQIIAGHNIPTVTVARPRTVLGAVSAAVYGFPARKLLMLGVTGTNGKTTVSYLIESGLRAAGHRTGMIGTIETRIDDERISSVHTTPEAPDVQALLAVMVERGVTACVMEVSSHAMSFGRVDPITFDVAGFTNLTQDHLDFHATLDEYFEAKARLFTPTYARRAVIYVTDSYGEKLATTTSIPTVTIARSESDSPTIPGQWTVGPSVLAQGTGRESTAKLTDPQGQSHDVGVAIPGDFNVANAALATVMLIEAGVAANDAVRGVGECAGVPGRMERVTSPRLTKEAPTVIVDFAHTPDAMTNVLRALEPRGRVITVVGAGGDRDQGKRQGMGAAAAANSDVVIVTDDNPRSEDPARIRDALLQGALTVPETERAHVVAIAGRRSAITDAMRHVNDRTDTVVILGKGHEQGQTIGDRVEPFDDRDVARAELEKVWGTDGGGSAR